MKSMMTMMIATLLLASGCATTDLGGGGSDNGFSHNRNPDNILQQLADSSQGG